MYVIHTGTPLIDLSMPILSTVWIVDKLSVHECNVVEMLGTPYYPPGYHALLSYASGRSCSG